MVEHPETVTALLRGLAVLQALCGKKVQSIRDLHSITGLPKPTLVRLLKTLIEAGYVYAMPDPTAYGVTAKVLSLAAGFEPGRYLTDRLGAALQRFQQSVPWPSDLAIFDGEEMVILGTSRQPGKLSVNREVGARVDARKTALGRAFLAYMPEADIKLPFSPEELVEFQTVLQTVRTRGYATSDRENLTTICALAAPVLQNEAIAASLNIIVVADAMSMAELELLYANSLVVAALEMSSLMSKTR